ncbi:MAG: hypothetical protein ACI319_10035 [Holdemanella porci]
MIKVQDFAHSKGVTDKAIYKHINRHREELGDHIQKQGKNGTWLDDYACEFISGLMISNPIVVGDSHQQAEIGKLKIRNEELMNQLLAAQQTIINLQGSMIELEVAKKQIEYKNDELNRAKEEIDRLKTRNFWGRIFNK